MRRSGTGRAAAGGRDDSGGVAVIADDAAASASLSTMNRNRQPLDKTGLASLSMRASTGTEEHRSHQSSPLPPRQQNPLEAVASALASLVASFSAAAAAASAAGGGGEEQGEPQGNPHGSREGRDWRARGCFPARLAAAGAPRAAAALRAAAAPNLLPFASSAAPASASHDLATTGSRVFPIFGREIRIYDFGVYVDSAALRTSASAAALRAAAPGALRAAAAVSSPGRVGGGGDGGKKKRKILRFVPVLPRLLDRRRDARAKRQQKQQQEQQQQQWELHVGNESGRSRQQQAQLQQPPRAAATATPVFGEQLPASEADDLGGEGRDAALPFGAALRSADDVPMSLVVRSRRALPIAILRAEYERILSRRIERLGGSADDKGLREMLSHFRADALPASARHPGGLLNGLGGLAGIAGLGGLKGFDGGSQGKSRNAGALAKGAVIEFRRSPGGKLTASVDGAHVATVESSALLAAAVFDLYVGALPVCGAARASAHQAVVAWVGDDGKKKKGEGGEEEELLARRLLAGGPRARATSGAAVCDDDDDDDDEEESVCKRGGGGGGKGGRTGQQKEQQQKEQTKRWSLLPPALFGGGGGSGGGSKEILG